jgi:hypothetical protein
MTKATAAFTVRGPNGLVSFKPEDDVPDEIAALVGEHVLDSKPDADELEDHPFAGLDFDNADEALKAALEKAGEVVESLQGQIAELTTERDDLQAFKDKILSGNLEDLDLDSLSKDDDEDAPDPDAVEAAAETAKAAEELFDPSEHHHAIVLKYLESADETEDARVRAAEKAGRARPSILGDEG